MTDFIKGSIIATAVAGLFGCASQQAPSTEMSGAGETVHCAGINSCKGQGECGGADHSCKGQNECKGKGWIAMTAAECTAQGGMVHE